MEKDISKLTETELDVLGYKMYESREQLMSQLQQVNNNLLIVRAEKQKREEKVDTLPKKK